MKVSKVDTVLPFPNQEEIGAAVRRLQNLDGAIRRAVELYRGYSHSGNSKKTEYFSRVAVRLKEVQRQETIERDEEILKGLHMLTHKVSRSDITLGMLIEQQKGFKGQVAPLQTRKLQVLALKGEVVFKDGSRVTDLQIVTSGMRVINMWLAGDLRLSDKPVGMSPEQRYYEDYARGY